MTAEMAVTLQTTGLASSDCDDAEPRYIVTGIPLIFQTNRKRSQERALERLALFKRRPEHIKKNRT